jgi:serine phosphatase RsbU (regulator of sigma subunit)
MSGKVVSHTGRAFGTSFSVCSSRAGDRDAGADWCDSIAISEQAVALTVGEVSGHGEAVAGTISAMRASVLRAIADLQDPADVLAIANDVASMWGDGILVTAIVAVLDHRMHMLRFANAGHPPPLLLTGDRHAFLERPRPDPPLGLFAHYHAANYVVALPLDALLVLHTDGLTEHDRDPDRRDEELVEVARLSYGRPAPNVARAIARHVFEKGRGDAAAAIALRTMPRATRDR